MTVFLPILRSFSTLWLWLVPKEIYGMDSAFYV